MRFANIELRIGNEDHSDSGPVRLSGNPVVAFYEGGIIERRAVFQLSRPATGRYLTLQRTVAWWTSIDDVLIGEALRL